MHGGRAAVSPNRYLSWVVLKHRSSGRKTVFMNTHMVSGAWNGKDNTDDPWRKEMWLKHRAEQTKVINDFTAQGMSVVYGGDFNRQNVEPFSPRDKQVVDTGIDHLGVVLAPGDELAGVQTAQAIDGYNSDHKAKLMRVTVSGCGPVSIKPTTTKPPTTKPPTTKPPTTKPPATNPPTTKAPTTKPPGTPKATGTPKRPDTSASPATPRVSPTPTDAPPTTAPTSSPQAPVGVPEPPVAQPQPAGPADQGVPDSTVPETTGGLASTGH